MKTLKEVVDEAGFPVYCVFSDGNEAIIEVPLNNIYIAAMYLRSNGASTPSREYAFLGHEVVTFYQPLKEVEPMKTLKEVVDEAGLPVYCYSELQGDYILYEEGDGGFPSFRGFDEDGINYLFGVGLRVEFYQSLKEDCSLIDTVHSKVNTDTCKCPTLLAGHHAECLWKP